MSGESLPQFLRKSLVPDLVKIPGDVAEGGRAIFACLECGADALHLPVDLLDCNVLVPESDLEVRN